MVEAELPDFRQDSAWARTKVNASRAYHSPAFGIASAIVGLVLSGIAILLTLGEDVSTEARVVIPILSGLLGLILCLLAVLAVQAAAAPYQQRNEAREENTVLKFRLAMTEQAGDDSVRALRIAAAQIREELSRAELALEQDDVGLFAGPDNLAAQWVEHREVLAHRGEIETYNRVAEAHRRILDVRRHTHESGDEYNPWVELDAGRVAAAIPAVKAALQALDAMRFDG